MKILFISMIKPGLPDMENGTIIELMNPDIIERVHSFFKNKGLTLSVAESCTGGLISHYLTILPGASSFFTSGIVAYSSDMKMKVLGVAPETIGRFGMISEETAREMAEKMYLISMTDYSLSTTGNLGPDVLEGKDEGLIYMAVSSVRGTEAKRLLLTGKRQENKVEASLSALRFLLECTDKK